MTDHDVIRRALECHRGTSMRNEGAAALAQLDALLEENANLRHGFQELDEESDALGARMDALQSRNAALEEVLREIRERAVGTEHGAHVDLVLLDMIDKALLAEDPKHG